METGKVEGCGMVHTSESMRNTGNVTNHEETSCGMDCTVR